MSRYQHSCAMTMHLKSVQLHLFQISRILLRNKHQERKLFTHNPIIININYEISSHIIQRNKWYTLHTRKFAFDLYSVIIWILFIKLQYHFPSRNKLYRLKWTSIFDLYSVIKYLIAILVPDSSSNVTWSKIYLNINNLPLFRITSLQNIILLLLHTKYRNGQHSETHKYKKFNVFDKL